MERRDTIIIGIVFAAFIALVAIDWRKLGFGAAGMEATPLQPDTAPGASGPATAWANVPISRFVYPPNIGGFVAPRNDNGAAAAGQPEMFPCGICG